MAEMARYSDVRNAVRNLEQAETMQADAHRVIFEYFLEKVEEYGLTEFASRCGRAKQQISSIKTKKAVVTTKTLLELLTKVTKDDFSEKNKD